MKYLLFLDYDGTLTPIVKKPSLAILSKSRRSILRKISRAKHILVAIISGRSLADVKKKVGIPHLIYAGNHGFEIQGPGIKLVHPAAQKTKPLLKKIKPELAQALKGIKGIIIEDKVLSLSVHYRQVSAKSAQKVNRIFNQVVKPYLKKRKIKVTQGKKVFEVRPPVNWNKGYAVLWLLKELTKKIKATPIYIGDDLTDEDAFYALRKKGLTIRVGEKSKTFAKQWLRDVDEVYNFLGIIAKKI